jgi:lipopolysaccharide transport system ATP-binding protein
MMSRPIIEVDNISLSYRHRRRFFRNVRKTVIDSVNFNIYAGETLGIIGQNGCGKSSLLKLLAGILLPDAGEVRREPRVRVSLQTLHAGFDQELSGRDNAELASVLMYGRPMRDPGLLDRIFEFSEIGEAFWEPVKTYSAGMRARLGFAIGRELEADVILIDEVLGVGDVSFKAKARHEVMSRMQSDQTYVVVSHSLSQIERLCDRVIWLDEGKVMGEGTPEEVVNSYVEHSAKDGAKDSAK